MNNRIHLSSFVKIGEDYHLVWLNLNFNHGASCNVNDHNLLKSKDAFE